MMHSSRSLLQIVKNCWSFVWNRQFLTFLFFLLLSASFWLFQAVNETYEEEFVVPIHLTGIPDNVVLTTDPPSGIRITLRDRGVTLLRYRYTRHFAPITIKWDEVSDNAGHVVLNASELIKSTLQSLEGSTHVVAFRPEMVEFYFNYGMSKRLPVVFQGRLRTDSTYSLLTVDVEPRTVLVYASKRVLDTLTAAYTAPIRLGSLTDTTVIRRAFVKIPGVKYVPDRVRITAIADRMIEKTVEVPVQGVNFPATKILRTFPSKVSITFQVGMSQYRKITPESFVLVVNYADLIGDSDNICPLSLKSVPYGVRRARINPSEVEYVVEEATPEETE